MLLITAVCAAKRLQRQNHARVHKISVVVACVRLYYAHEIKLNADDDVIVRVCGSVRARSSGSSPICGWEGRKSYV